MSDKLVVHDPRGYPPKVSGRRLAYIWNCIDDVRRHCFEQLFRDQI